MSTAIATRSASGADVTGERIFEIKTALGEGALHIHRFQCKEELGRMSEIELELLSTRSDLSFEKILGTDLTIKVQLAPGEVRHFNGIVTRFSHTGFTVGRYHQYRASVRTWPWLMTRSTDCKIFQKKSVPEILKEVFAKYPKVKFKVKLSAKYQPREYCVQYRETDFNFVSRLMGQEGIYYFFAHADGEHTLILADSLSAHEVAKGLEEVQFITGDRSGQPNAGCITNWDCVREVQSGRYVHTSFDFTKP